MGVCAANACTLHTHVVYSEHPPATCYIVPSSALQAGAEEFPVIGSRVNNSLIAEVLTVNKLVLIILRMCMFRIDYVAC